MKDPSLEAERFARELGLVEPSIPQSKCERPGFGAVNPAADDSPYCKEAVRGPFITKYREPTCSSCMKLWN